MFFCEKCRLKNKWPEGFSKSVGPCELCRKSALCHDVPSSFLPFAKKSAKKPRRRESADDQT